MFKRRSMFAAPFVVTALLAPGCGSTQKPEDPPPDPNVNKWVENGGYWIFAQEGGDRVWYSPADGTCELHYSLGGCPKGAMCNPPPPQEVDCPPGLPPEATPAQPDATPPNPDETQ